jgi:hypothetical protein
MVVAVPLAASVERDEEQVRSVDLLEHSSRVCALENIVTYSSRQAIEHRSPNQEFPELVGKRSKSLVVQVVGDQAVVPGETLSGGGGFSDSRSAIAAR